MPLLPMTLMPTLLSSGRSAEWRSKLRAPLAKLGQGCRAVCLRVAFAALASSLYGGPATHVCFCVFVAVHVFICVCICVCVPV